MTFPLAVFPVIFPCLYYVTHADLRYRHPIDPVLCLLTAIAVASAWNLLAREGHTEAGEDTRTEMARPLKRFSERTELKHYFPAYPSLSSGLSPSYSTDVRALKLLQTGFRRN